jgi:hypothetical protein
MYNRFLEQLKLYSLPYNLTYHRASHKTILNIAHTLYLCASRDIGKKTAIIVFSINWLVFVDETECVHYLVGTEYFNIIWFNFRLKIMNTRQSHITFIHIQLKKI